MKVVVNFYPIDIAGKEDYLRLGSDITGGEIVAKDIGILNVIKKISNKDVHAHGRGFPFPELSCIFAKKSIYTPHFNNLGSLWWTKIARRFIWNRYTKIIAQTEYGKRNYIMAGIRPEKIEVLPISIDYNFWSKPKYDDKFRKKYRLGKEQFALCAGIRKGKNIDVIAQACKKAGIKLVAVGFKDKHEIRSGLEFLIPPKEYLELDNTIFTGFISNQELLAAFDATSVFINSSESGFECFCLAVYQAAAAGVPLCLPDFGVFEAFKGCALFHNNHDSNQLAKNIKTYLENKDIAAKNIAHAKQVAKSVDYETVKNKFQEFYQRVGIK